MEKRGQNTRQRFDWKRVTEFFLCATTAAPMCSGANSRPSFRVAFAEFFFYCFFFFFFFFFLEIDSTGWNGDKTFFKKKEQKWNTVCVCYQVAMMKYSSALPHLGVAFLCDLMARSCNCGPPPPPPGQTDSLHSSENVFFFSNDFSFRSSSSLLPTTTTTATTTATAKKKRAFLLEFLLDSRWHQV